ncbi:MgtC/SapB family protein [Meiothermus sp. QL-1]|uniref:MgtC/SapB family protein n=1 Tax=Meiothermus sp. QL-1 TaxID=2058095 RepID=UPI000E0C163D|nr:MgtC/SapB family protein [Meiothermus sp. QL-1]RDI96035.1 MgtC/SapB family protein [Meiothermus sp. QL-1]
MDLGEFMLRVLVALLLGAFIGVERQRRQSLAGMRTNALVSVGAALFVSISAMVEVNGVLDPTRIAAQVVSGIGFLGAGVILREGLNVRGLNTAATLWGAAAVGSLAGSGFLPQAALGALAVLFINLVVRGLARYFEAKERNGGGETEVTYSLQAVCRSEDETRVRLLLLQNLVGSPLRLRLLETSDLDTPGRLQLRAELVSLGRQERSLEEVVGRLSLEPGVSAVRWRVLGEVET